MVMPRAAEPLPDGAGRHERFRALFEQEFDFVWTSLRRLGVHSRELQDVAQDVFVHVYRKLDDYQPSRPVRPWLFAFAVGCAADWRRLARHRVEALGMKVEGVAAAPSADAVLERKQDVALVLRALEHVGVERRPVFILHEFDGFSMREITSALDVPLFTGYSRLRVAREEFTVALRRLLLEEGNP